MGPSLQNLRTKGLMGKIFRNKELGEARRWRVEVFSAGCVAEALGTVPLCAFCILGKGCSSQECGIFLWKTVEKDRNPIHRRESPQGKRDSGPGDDPLTIAWRFRRRVNVRENGSACRRHVEPESHFGTTLGVPRRLFLRMKRPCSTL